MHPYELGSLAGRVTTARLGFADQEDLRLRFDVLTKTRQPELHRYWTARDRAANVRLFRLASEMLRAIEAEAFPPWQEQVMGVAVRQTCPNYAEAESPG